MQSVFDPLWLRMNKQTDATSKRNLLIMGFLGSSIGIFQFGATKRYRDNLVNGST